MGTAAGAVIDIDVEGQEAASELKDIRSALTDLADHAKTAFAGVGAYLAVDSLRDAASEMLGVFSEAERANTRLNTTLKSTGNATGFTTDTLEAMRDSFHETLGVAKTDMTEMQNIFARTRSVTGDVFVGAQQTAIDMAKAFGMDIPNAAEELSEAMQDPANELEKFRRFGIVFTDSEKQMLNQLQSTGRAMEAQRYVLNALNKVVGGAAADAADTYGGAQERIKNKIEGLYGAIGELIAKALIPMQPIIESIIDTSVAWIPVLEEIAFGIISGADALMEWMAPLAENSAAVQEWAAIVKSIFTDWRKYIAVALLNAGADVMGFADAVAFYFTDTIPTYAKTLWIVMKDVFSQLDELIVAVMKNMKKNVDDFWAAIENVMSGGDFDFKPTSVLEGFELKLSELPKVAEREMSETEKIMRQAADDLSMEIGQDLNKEIQRRETAAKEERKKRDLSKTGEKTDKELNLGQSDTGTGSGTGTTEGLLDLSNRIAEAAAQQKVVSAVASVAEQQQKTNDLLTGIKEKETKVEVTVKQNEVVAAINESTRVLAAAYEKGNTFA